MTEALDQPRLPDSDCPGGGHHASIDRVFKARPAPQASAKLARIAPRHGDEMPENKAPIRIETASLPSAAHNCQWLAKRSFTTINMAQPPELGIFPVSRLLYQTWIRKRVCG
jgi:hypothetical protein